MYRHTSEQAFVAEVVVAAEHDQEEPYLKRDHEPAHGQRADDQCQEEAGQLAASLMLLRRDVLQEGHQEAAS